MSCFLAGMSDERIIASLKKGKLVVKFVDSNQRKSEINYVIKDINIFYVWRKMKI